MANLVTMVQDLKVDTDEVDSNLDRIRHKIAQAVDHHLSKDYWFLVQRFQIDLKPNLAGYSLKAASPPVRSVKGDTALLLVGGSTVDMRRLHRRNYRTLEDMLVDSPVPTFPAYFAVNNDELIVYPPPSGLDVFSGWGRALDHSPKPEWDATLAAWNFPDDSFTNVWFTDGYQVIREYACWLLFSGPKADKERAKDAAERYRMIERDVRLETEERNMMLMQDAQ